MGIPGGEEKEKGAESLFKEIIVENFSNLEKELDKEVHETNRTSYYLNAERPFPRHIILKLSKVNDYFKESRRKKDSNLQRYLQL